MKIKKLIVEGSIKEVSNLLNSILGKGIEGNVKIYFTENTDDWEDNDVSLEVN